VPRNATGMVPTKRTRSAELPFSNADTSQLGRVVRFMYRYIAYCRHRFEEQNWDIGKVLGRSPNMCDWDHGSSKFSDQYLASDVRRCSSIVHYREHCKANSVSFEEQLPFVAWKLESTGCASFKQQYLSQACGYPRHQDSDHHHMTSGCSE
jgi:hypothetical protein